MVLITTNIFERLFNYRYHDETFIGIALFNLHNSVRIVLYHNLFFRLEFWALNTLNKLPIVTP